MAVESSIEGTVKPLISGGTGTGKTTLLRILANPIPENERILVIEDTPELKIRKPNIVAVGSQTSIFKTNVSFDGLLKDTLRFGPDRIILGEGRGIEARTLVDSFTPAIRVRWRSSTPIRQRKPLRLFANLVMRSQAQSTYSDTEAEIGEAVDFVVHVERQSGRSVVREVLALRGCDRDAKRFVIEPVFSVQHAAAEINQSHHICASIRLDKTTAAKVDQYATFIHASADDVVDKVLNYVFSKDRDFQDFLKTPQAKQVASTLRVRKDPSNGAAEEPGKKLVAGVESTPSVRAVKA